MLDVAHTTRILSGKEEVSRISDPMYFAIVDQQRAIHIIQCVLAKDSLDHSRFRQHVLAPNEQDLSVVAPQRSELR